MQQDLTGFMKPTTDQNTNKLKFVVTPYDQKFKRREAVDGFSLFEIINNENLLKRFPKNTFPEFQIMENSEIFMQPSKRIIQTLHEYYIKWLILDDNFKVSHDHDYPYVSIPKTGYLVKIIIPKLYDNPIDNDFTIEYTCDINNIEVRPIDSIGDINQSDHNSINVNIKEDLQIEQFDPVRYPKLYSLLSDNREFFKNYLLDLF